MESASEFMAEHQNVTSETLRGEVDAARTAGHIGDHDAAMVRALIETAERNRVRELPLSPFIEPYSVQAIRDAIDRVMRKH